MNLLKIGKKTKIKISNGSFIVKRFYGYALLRYSPPVEKLIDFEYTSPHVSCIA